MSATEVPDKSPPIAEDASKDVSKAQPTADANGTNSEDSDVLNSLENLSIGNNKPESNNKEKEVETGKSDTVTVDETAKLDDAITVAQTKEPNGASPIPRILNREVDSTSASSETSDQSSPVIVVSPQAQEPFSHQLQNMLCDPMDQPDPRLIDALENPRDRIFVIKLEKDIVAFIEDKNCEIFDMPPINSYHRLLAHKMAEYYRLTHVADSSGASVRMFRGQAARIPITSLAAWPVATQQIQKAVSSGAIPAVKIMRRNGTDTPPRGSSTSGAKANSETSSENGTSEAAAGSNAKSTREEREAAYQEARARIFKDFVESPPETPPPAKQEKSRRQDKNDDFSGRSQFYPVMPQAFYPPHAYHDPSLMQQQQPVMQMSMQPLQALPQQQMPQNQHFNPTANFTPSPQQFTPSAPPFANMPQNRAYPNFTPGRERGYQSAHQQQQQPPAQPPIYPMQQQNGYYPNPSQSPSSMHGSRSYNPNLPPQQQQQQPQATMMQSSYSSNGSVGGYPQQHQSSHLMQPPQPHYNPATTPPPQAMMGRQQQQQQPYSSMPHLNQMSFAVAAAQQQQRLNQPPLGWGNVGAAMQPRSTSAPGGHHPMVEGFGTPGVGAWGWNAVGRGNGAAGGMNMRM